jgi:N-acetylneuraminic acid mutarotase
MVAATLPVLPANAAAPGTWKATGSMQTARWFHTATLLRSGKVLVAGGEINVGFGTGKTATAELYDPVTGAWHATGSLHTARFQHTATLLRNGKVLVAGGFTTTAELYDPTAGTWSLTGSISTAIGYQTATLLRNGKVLVAGGFGDFGATSAAELYDPSTGTWKATGSMARARGAHTATLLRSGKVLVAGGDNNGRFEAMSELYNPSAGTWSATGSLSTGRAAHTATLLPDGDVLVAGGLHSTPRNTNATDTAELYNPSTGTWSATGSMSTPRQGPTATLLPSGKVLVAGGFPIIYGYTVTATAELYNPSTGTWSATGTMNTARGSQTATLLHGNRVLVAGGLTTFTGTSTAELYKAPRHSPRH